MGGPRRESSEQSAARFLQLRAGYDAQRNALRAEPNMAVLASRTLPGRERGTLGLVEEIMRLAGRPMSVYEILDAAGGRLPTRSVTPYNVVARDLSMDVKRWGEGSRFMRIAPGRYALRPRPAPPGLPDPGDASVLASSQLPAGDAFEVELRRRREERLRESRAQRERLRAVPAQWRFVEKHVPGAWAAWVSQVGLAIENFSLGITGRPTVAIATLIHCRHDSSCGCRIFEYGSWKMRNRAV